MTRPVFRHRASMPRLCFWTYHSRPQKTDCFVNMPFFNMRSASANLPPILPVQYPTENLPVAPAFGLPEPPRTTGEQPPPLHATITTPCSLASASSSTFSILRCSASSSFSGSTALFPLGSFLLIGSLKLYAYLFAPPPTSPRTNLAG